MKRILINVSQVLAALVVLAVLIFLAFKGSDWLLYLFSLTFIGAAVLLVLYVSRAVVRGELPGRFGSVTFRHVSPISFWIQVSIHVLFTGFILFSGLALVGLAPHWFIALLRSMHSRR